MTEEEMREILAEQYAAIWPLRESEIQVVRSGDSSMFDIPYRVAMSAIRPRRSQRGMK